MLIMWSSTTTTTTLKFFDFFLNWVDEMWVWILLQKKLEQLLFLLDTCRVHPMYYSTTKIWLQDSKIWRFKILIQKNCLQFVSTKPLARLVETHWQKNSCLSDGILLWNFQSLRSKIAFKILWNSLLLELTYWE